MKIALLVLSLLINATWGATLIARKLAKEETPAMVSPSVRAPGTKTVATLAVATVKQKPGSATESATLHQVWPTAPGSDLPSLIAKLRAQGFPSGVLLAIARFMIYEDMRPRWKELMGNGETPLWKNPSYYYDPKNVAVMRQLQKEQTNRLKAILGPEAETEPMYDYYATVQQRRYGDLSPEKFRKAEDVMRDYSEMSSDVFLAAQFGTGGQTVLLPEDREKLTYLEKQKREDLAKVLSPEELLDYDLRTSYTANQLRAQLVGFDPTPEEFRALFKLQQAVDERLGIVGQGNGMLTASVYRDRQAALKNIEPDLEAALGPDRAAAYKQATDPQYVTMNRLVSRLDLPATTAVAVVNVQQDVQKRAAALRTDSSLSPAERTAQLSALAEEATGKISTAMGGQRGLDAYKQYGGAWLQTLTRPPASRPPGN